MWDQLDLQMKAFSSRLRDDLRLSADASNGLASTMASELKMLSQESLQRPTESDAIDIKERLTELIAFQGWCDWSRNYDRVPFVTRAQVVYQNYVCFVHLSDNLFRMLRKTLPAETATRRCSRFLSDNPVRAFRNAMAHGNWQYRSDFQAIIYWARKGDSDSELMERWEVEQTELNFWQSLARTVSYVAYNTVGEARGDGSGEPSGRDA